METLKKVVFILVILVQLIPLKFWISCKSFFDQYHFTLYDVELQIIDAIAKDSGFPVLVTRAFHNKVIQSVLDIYKRYTNFFDLNLLINLLTFVGIFGVLLSVWYFLNQKKKDKKIALLLALALLIPLIEVVFNPNAPFFIKLVFISLPLNLLAIFGHYNFIRNQKKEILLIVYFLLITISLVWIFLPNETIKYCVLN